MTYKRNDAGCYPLFFTIYLQIYKKRQPPHSIRRLLFIKSKRVTLKCRATLLLRE